MSKDDFDFSNFDTGEEALNEVPKAAPPPPRTPPARPPNAAPSAPPRPAPQRPAGPPPARPTPPPAAAKSPSTVDKKVVNLTQDIPVQIVAVLGKKSVTIKEIVSMHMGQVVELNRLPNEAIDLVANGKLIAKGELVEVEGRLGVRILKIFD